ncbi:hypothetical protein SEVIR_6G041900v4 [Setaria viridis]|uniref:AAA+ ATPase domain-containing protein n=1 Tax=Setaria viridis TaxID=4556 RepID=A0A4U6U009_SETVI|nr:disease resistance protein RGA5-like [Setaria viridis]TKW08711.1 hypothetical protein SEVIR_6G041900v2 [Setaria viridis]TKW08712.1 hypothetical protein SEVIR_6G041900v2 [Setaria viridis]
MKSAIVSVSMGVMEPLLSKLSKLMEEEYDKLRGVSKQIKFLRDELRAMSPALEMLGDARDLSPLMRDWRNELRELAYDMEDCVDSFLARVDDHEQHHGGLAGILGLFRKFKKMVARHEIACQIEELKKRVMEVSERHKRYNFVESGSSHSSTCLVDPRLPALYEDIDRLVGIDGSRKHIIELLAMESTGSSAKLKVVSIVGCGGLGKTTLAKQVFNTIKSQFSCAAFVSVSQSPDVGRILRDIAKGVGLSDKTAQDDDEQQLIDKLREHLQDKRYFVVLDDVWNTEAWKFIKLALPKNDLGSRIIATTRNAAIALSFSSQSGDVYQMKPLSFDDSKRLLFKRSFGSENLNHGTHLGSVPDEILRKCDGLPLAIITISSILRDQHTKNEWDRVLNDIGSAFAKNPAAGNMTTILSLSYFDIPRHLKTCLLYLSVFPEDYEIEKQRLINRWIAEGFVHEEEGRTKYEIGESYFNDLTNRSMIQPVDIKYGEAKACRVHDIILDYIKCEAVKENFVTSLDAAEHAYTSEYKVHRLCVKNGDEEHVSLWQSQILSHVRSVTVFGQPVKTSLLPSTALRVLDLGDCGGMTEHHIASIGTLFHLKYLRLCSRSITKLPEEIGELQHLQTLDVRGTRIDELPPTIIKLQHLAYLYVNHHTRFQDGMIGRMHSLEELRQYGVLYKQRKSLQEFSNLTKLRTLEIRLQCYLFNCSGGRPEAIFSYFGTLLSSCNLHNLSISDYQTGRYALLLDPWHPTAPCCLRKLSITSCCVYKVPNWMGSLGNLEVLELLFICVRPEDVEILGAIPSLLFLELTTTGGSNRRIFIHGNNGFRILKYFSLFITGCGTSLEFEEGSMPKLEHIKLALPVHNMECLNGASNFGIQHLSALSKIEVKISGNHISDTNYDPMNDNDDGIIRYVAAAIDAAVNTLPNRPTIRFETEHRVHCEHFECVLRKANQRLRGLLTEWFKIWQIKGGQTEQVTEVQTGQEALL